VFAETKDVKLSHLAVPVGSDPLEYPGPILEGIILDANLGLINREELPLEIRVCHPVPLLDSSVKFALNLAGIGREVNSFRCNDLDIPCLKGYFWAVFCQAQPA
jgi:hypothetical protein